MRQLRRTSTGFGIAALVLALVGPALASDHDRPAAFDGLAAATGYSIILDTDPQILPIEEIVRLELPQADSTFTSVGRIEARGGWIYPGPSGTGGPSLLCTFGLPCDQIEGGTGQPFPPAYPFVALAQHPSNPDAETADGISEAHASADGVSSESSFGRNAATGPIVDAMAVAVDVGLAETSTQQGFEDGALVVRAKSHVEDVLIAGQLRIASIDSVSVSRADGDKLSETVTTFDIGGITLAGTPLKLGDRGLVVDSTKVGGDELAEANRQLRDFVADNNLEISFVNPLVDEGQRGTNGHALGLLVSVDVPVSSPVGQLPSIPLPPEAPLPGDPNIFLITYNVTASLGAAGTSAWASNDTFSLDFDLPDLDLPVPGVPSAPVGGGPVTIPDLGSPVDAPDVPVVAAPDQPGPSGQPGSAGTVSSTPAPELLAALGLQPVESNLSALHPILLGAAILLFLLTRLLAAALARSEVDDVRRG